MPISFAVEEHDINFIIDSPAIIFNVDQGGEITFIVDSPLMSFIVDDSDSIIFTPSVDEIEFTINNSNDILFTYIETNIKYVEIEEQDMAYASRIDTNTNGDVIYRAEADAGTLDSSMSWRIRKITITPDGDTNVTWANGTADFDKVWDNRLSYTYI